MRQRAEEGGKRAREPKIKDEAARKERDEDVPLSAVVWRSGRRSSPAAVEFVCLFIYL